MKAQCPKTLTKTKSPKREKVNLNLRTIEQCNRLIELNPNDYQAYFARVCPHFIQVYYERGYSQSKIGDVQEAITDYTKVIENWSYSPDTYSHRGVSKHRLGKDQGALEDLNNAIERDCTFAWAYFYRGISEAALKNYLGAIVDYLKSAREY